MRGAGSYRTATPKRFETPIDLSTESLEVKRWPGMKDLNVTYWRGQIDEPLNRH